MDLVYEVSSSDSNSDIDEPKRRYYKRVWDLDDFTNDEIIRVFRLNRNGILMLVQQISNLLVSNDRRKCVLSPTQQLLIALRYNIV